MSGGLAMSSTLHGFFNSVLPNVGVYVTAYRKDGKIKQKCLKSKAAVIDFCELNSMNAMDCWFATSTYKQGWHDVNTVSGIKKKLRTQDNSLAQKSLWLDIDVGEGKDYETRIEATQALAKFAKELGLPRPWVVGSGASGIHVYWAFDEEIKTTEWKYLADRLHAATKALGLKADASRTRDSASIMRCPLTWNMKGEASQVTILVVGVEKPYDFYKDIFSKFEPVADSNQVRLPIIDKNSIPSIANLNSKKVLTDYFTLSELDYPKRDAIELMKGCGQLNPKDMDDWNEPIFRGFLATIRHCEHGEYVAHKVASKSKYYTGPEFTETKLQYLKDNNIAPYRCETFAELRPEVCKRCPYNGVINSPISVPSNRIPVAEIQEPEIVIDHKVNTHELQEEPELTPAVNTIPEIKSKNSMVNASGCWARVKNTEGDWYWMSIYEYPVYPVQRIKSYNSNGDLQISYVFRKHSLIGHDDFQLTGDTLMGYGLNSFLGSVGFLLKDKERKLMAGLLIDILKETEHTLEETDVSDSLGWDEDQNSFLLGNKLYKTNGDVVEISPKGKASEYSNLTVARGSLEQWKNIANVYNKDGLEWGQAAVASAFASPLMPIGALEKAALMFITGEKGVGKSTALALAVSVFGNPARMMINKDDTYLARLSKLGIMNNISAAFDEMTDLTPKEASELAYQITQGRGKDKMAQGGEALMHNSTYWSCLPVMSANDSMIAALSQHSADPTAQMSRILEIKATDINNVYNTQEFDNCQRLVRSLPQNYGTAGDLYIRYVTSHLDEVKELIYQIEKRFLKYTGLTNSYRFWTYMCTRMIVGVMIANKLGLVKYDVAKFFAYLVKVAINSRDNIDKYKWSPESVFPQFLSQHMPNRLVVKSAQRGKDNPDNPDLGAMNDFNYVIQKPANGREIIMRVELNKERCLISIPAIKDWCKRAGIDYNEFLNYIKRDYRITNENRRCDLGKHTVYRNNGIVSCISVKLPKSMLVEDEDDEE